MVDRSELDGSLLGEITRRMREISESTLASAPLRTVSRAAASA